MHRLTVRGDLPDLPFRARPYPDRVPVSPELPDHPDYRFTLANERTLLAWLRTGLALVAGGVAVATYAPDLGVRWGSAAVSLALVLLGLLTALAGYGRWRANEAAIEAGRALPSSLLVPAVVAAVTAVVVVVAVLVGVEVLRG
ncbi:putative membrane protein [Blastococcus saxobsidens]|uniref:Putative membrane protein n=1 Tax=Blastococcus saxobsidens TaxID=138336 RepID=A0A4Q7YBX2_9ACTN|nr:putative membrane protein [Blastococcus saxobsidens]